MLVSFARPNASYLECWCCQWQSQSTRGAIVGLPSSRSAVGIHCQNLISTNLIRTCSSKARMCSCTGYSSEGTMLLQIMTCPGMKAKGMHDQFSYTIFGIHQERGKDRRSQVVRGTFWHMHNTDFTAGRICKMLKVQTEQGLCDSSDSQTEEAWHCSATMTLDEKLTIRWPLNSCSLYHNTHGTCWHNHIVHVSTAWLTGIAKLYWANVWNTVFVCVCVCVSHMAQRAAGLHDDQQQPHIAECSLGSNPHHWRKWLQPYIKASVTRFS